MKTAFQMPQSVSITVPQDESGTYKYSGQYTGRSAHDPWVWVRTEHEEMYPHFTCYSNGFDNGGFLTRFHISTAYNGHQGLHIWFNVNSNGIVRLSNVDGNRLQGAAQEAEAWVNEDRQYFVTLAQNFVNNTLF
jgi:hypothetical protein